MDDKKVAKDLFTGIKESGQSLNANDNIDLEAIGIRKDFIRLLTEEAVRSLIHCLMIDQENDPNTIGTAERVSRMLVDEWFKGRYEPRPKITTFPNTKNLDELYTVGPIQVRSTCSHHFVPIEGWCWIGVVPGETLIGLSKFARLCEWIMARPQIQEEATVQLADEIEGLIQPLGLGVVVKARHLCMTSRGVREPSAEMTTSVMRGILREDARARSEFFELLRVGNV